MIFVLNDDYYKKKHEIFCKKGRNLPIVRIKFARNSIKGQMSVDASANLVFALSKDYQSIFVKYIKYT